MQEQLAEGSDWFGRWLYSIMGKLEGQKKYAAGDASLRLDPCFLNVTDY